MAPITQKPATVALKSGPFTHGVTARPATATSRSVTSSGGVRRAGSA